MDLILVFLFFCLTILLIKSMKNSKNEQPPGPWGMPIFGHLLFLGEEPYNKAAEWGKKYGPIISVKFGSYPSVFINDTELIKKLLKDPLTHGRSHFKFFKDRCFGELKGLIFTDGDDWHDLRKLSVQTLKKFGLSKESVEHCINEEITYVLDKIKSSSCPINLRHLFETSVAIQAMTFLIGERFSPENEEFREHLKNIIKQSPDKKSLCALALTMPWITSIHNGINEFIGYNKLLGYVNESIQFFKKYIDAHKETYQPNEPRDMIDMYFDKMNETNDPNSVFHSNNKPEEWLAWLLMDMFSGAGETMTSTLCWAIVALAKEIKIQEKIYEEIVKVIGLTRAPSFKDRASCPYTEGFIMEVLRYRPIFPLSFPRAALEDIIFEGHKIAKGTIIFPNLYAAHHDEKYWKNPEVFDPTRFVNSDTKAMNKPQNLLSFTLGKRNCVGELSARETMFLFIVSIVQKFKVLPAPNEKPTFERENNLFLLHAKCKTASFKERN